MAGAARVLVLGCGYAGVALARLARERGLDVLANVRSDARAAQLRAEGFGVIQQPSLDEAIAEHADARTRVLVAFPPDGETDARVAPSLARAAAVTYLSSTGVYAEVRGLVDDATPVPAGAASADRSARLLAAEAAYLRHGATVLRCPAIYGPDRGLHVRILRGQHRIPGDGSQYLSAVHVEDLAALILACAAPGETMLVGDRAPSRQIDVVRFVCESYGAPMPPLVPLESVHASLRADRRIDASRALAMLTAAGSALRYPTYREGMAPSATGLVQVGEA